MSAYAPQREQANENNCGLSNGGEHAKAIRAAVHYSDRHRHRYAGARKHGADRPRAFGGGCRLHLHQRQHAAGRIEGDVLNLRLYAGVGGWRPEGPQGEPIEIAAFGEEGAGLSIPGPLIRVREGTTVVLALRNALGSALRVNGLCGRPGACDAVSVAAVIVTFFKPLRYLIISEERQLSGKNANFRFDAIHYLSITIAEKRSAASNSSSRMDGNDFSILL